MTAPRHMRMFPLGSVLFPRGVMPLHIFEPRYLTLITEALEGDRTFGVVLIERGSEVGGGDVRFDVGSAAQIVDARFIDDDRMAVVAVGVRRIRVDEWLEDDPFPQALVSELPQGEAGDDVGDRVGVAWRAWQRLTALASELGVDVGNVDPDLPDDPADAIWTVCALAPLEQIDRQRLLEIDEPGERASRLAIALEERAEILEARLAGGI